MHKRRNTAVSYDSGGLTHENKEDKEVGLLATIRNLLSLMLLGGEYTSSVCIID